MKKQQRPQAAQKEATKQSGTDRPYTVLARRYRPQQFADLVGQEALVQALTNALRSQRVAHAYLFTGARGVGKTSAARILAKCLNCVQGPTVTPCDQCESCRAIAVGEDVDVIEIDGASNNRVEEIRELRSHTQYRPTRSRYKIYIIDEVHMLTTSAFNALLKTLEEPPPHVKFIFATTEVHKVPLTIVSRCQRFDFASIRTEDIVRQLRKIVTQEGVTAEEEALRLIARRASGSLRDAESLLDQALAFADTQLSLGHVEQLFGLAGEEQILALAEAILDHDAARAWKLLDDALRRGVQPGELLDQLLEYWRDLLLLKTVGEASEAFTFADRHRPRLQQRAEALQLDTILTAMDLLANTKGRLRFSSHPRVLVEMVLVRLTRLESLTSLTELAERLLQPKSGREEVARQANGASANSPAKETSRPFAAEFGAGSRAASGPPSSVSSTGSPLASSELVNAGEQVEDSAGRAGEGERLTVGVEPRAPTAVSGQSKTGGPQRKPASGNDANPADAPPVPDQRGTQPGFTPSRAVSGPLELTESALDQLRQALLEYFGNSLLRFDLERAKLAICAPNCLALSFPSLYNVERSRCEQRRRDLESALRHILGRDIQLRLERESGSPHSTVVEPSGSAQRFQQLEQIPLVRAVLEKLGGRWIPERTDPAFGQAELEALANSHAD